MRLISSRLLLALTACYITTTDATDKCNAEYTKLHQCVFTGIQSTFQALSPQDIDGVQQGIIKCFTDNQCPAPDFKADVWTSLPPEYQDVGRDVVQLWESLPDNFKTCVLVKVQQDAFTAIQNCIKAGGVGSFEKPDMDLDSQLQRSDADRLKLKDIITSKLKVLNAFGVCIRKNGPPVLDKLKQCTMAVKQRILQAGCNIRDQCRAQVTDADARQCSSRLQRICTAFGPCVQQAKANLQGLGDTLLASAGGPPPLPGAGVPPIPPKPPGAPQLQALRQKFRDCETKTNFQLPKDKLSAIIAKLPQKPIPDEVKGFLRNLAAAQLDEEDLNPCKKCM